MARRAASICRLVIQAASRAFKPYPPNANVEPRTAIPVRRPRCCFRNLTRLGASISSAPRRDRRARTTQAVLGHLPLLFGLQRLWKHLAVVDPALDPDQPVRCLGLGKSVVDVGSQGIQWHPPLAIPFSAGDFCPA